MKDWLVSGQGENAFWITRIDVNLNGETTYLCGCCEGPLDDHAIGLFGSSKGSPGGVACAICWKCHMLLDGELPANELGAQIELLLDNTANSA